MRGSAYRIAGEGRHRAHSAAVGARHLNKLRVDISAVRSGRRFRSSQLTRVAGKNSEPAPVDDDLKQRAGPPAGGSSSSSSSNLASQLPSDLAAALGLSPQGAAPLPSSAAVQPQPPLADGAKQAGADGSATGTAAISSWVEQLQQQSRLLAGQLAQYRTKAEEKAAALAAAPLDPAARRELEELTLVLQGALEQADMLSRQAALAEVLQHRVAEQEEVLAQLHEELEQVERQRVAEYESTLFNIRELEGALVLASEQVESTHRAEELAIQKADLEARLAELQAEIEQGTKQLADTRAVADELRSQLRMAQAAKGAAEATAADALKAKEAAEARLQALEADYDRVAAEVKRVREAAAEAASRGGKARRKTSSRDPSKGFANISKDAPSSATSSRDDDGMGGDKEGEGGGKERGGLSNSSDDVLEALPDLKEMVVLLEEKETGMAALKGELEAANGKLAEASRELQAANDKVADLEKQFAVQKAELEEAARVQVLEAEEKLNAKLDDVKKLLDDYQQQVVVLSQQNTQLEEEALALEQKLGEAEAAVDARAAEAEALSVAVAASGNTSDVVKAELATAQATLEETKAELDDIKAELKAAVNREAHKAVELSRSSQDLLLLQRAQTALQAERDELAKKVVALRSSQFSGEQAVSEAVAAAEAAEAKLKETSKQLAGAQVQLSTEAARAQQLAAELEKARSAESALAAELAVVSAAVEGEREESVARKARVEELTAQLAALQQSVSGLTADTQGLQTLAEQVSTRDKKLAELSEQLAAASEGKRATSQQLAAAQAELAAAQAKVAALEVKAGSLEELQSAVAVTDSLKKELAQLQQALDTKDKGLSALQAQSTQLSQEVSSLKQELGAARAAAAEAERALAEAAARGGASGEEAQQMMRAAQEQVELAVRARLQVEGELRLARSAGDASRAQVAALQGAAAELQAQLEVQAAAAAAATAAAEAAAATAAAAQEEARQLTEQAVHLDELKVLVLKEAEAAGDILAKAERVVRAVALARSAAPPPPDPDAGSLTKVQEAALREQLVELTVTAQEQAAAAAEAAGRAAELEDEVDALRQELAVVRSARTGVGLSAEQALLEEALVRERSLAERLAASEARALSATTGLDALTVRARALEDELRRRDAEAAAQLPADRDGKVAAMAARLQALEAQNSQLRAAAARRDAVLQQSRSFLEAQLLRLAPAGSAPGAAAAAAAAAGAGAAVPQAGGGGSGGSGSTGGSLDEPLRRPSGPVPGSNGVAGSQ